MAERPKGYGMTAELDRKKHEKYDPQLEEEAKNWIEAVIGEPVFQGASGYDAFGNALKNGSILCRLINTLQPGSVKKVNESKMAFKMMENIGFFLDAITAYGVAKMEQFQTVDLYELQNIGAVVNCIHALGRQAQKKGFNGPALGVKESDQNKREFTDQQLRAGQNVIGLQMGSNKGASQAGQSFGKPRHIID